MNPPMIQRWTIAKLRRHLQDKRFAVPKLQRNFVWDANRAAKLLDSIYRNIPVGALFLWEMDRKSAHLIRQSANVLPSFDSANRHVWFVIDGQQRLSVIYQAFEADRRQNDAGREIDFGRLCFVVNPDPDADDAPRITYRKPVDRQFIPLRDILAPDWRRRLSRNATKKQLRAIRECRQRLLNYPVPIVTVESATLEEIGEVFIRVNSQGMRITSADRAIALMGELDVRAMAVELRQKLREKRFNLGGIDAILMGFNLITERPVQNADPPKLEALARRWSRKIEADHGEKSAFEKLWHRYQDAFLKAVDYLRKPLPVFDESFLPSANMLATLSVFFFHHRGQPSTAQAREIRKWFWTTGVAQRYTGRGYHQNIAADARWFEGLAQGSRKPFVFRNLLEPSEVQSAEYGARSARTRAFFCLLAEQGPLYLENAEPIPIEQDVLSHANSKHRHHIFPQAQLKNHVAAHVYNSLSNICFLVARNNQTIGKRRPASYLDDYRGALGGRRFRRVMKSHLIPVGADAGVWDAGLMKAFKKFRQERMALICKEFEKKAGIRLFRRN